MSPTYNHKSIENKWRSCWEKHGIYQVDVQSAKRPFYNLWMFPYPSGARMHVGHAYASTGSDIVGRFKRMQGYDVLQPMGFDAFGIHGENYAIKVGEHPWQLMEDLCNRFRDEQFKAIGHGYDWSKEVRTYWPEYYKWTQWIFVQLFKHGLAERKKANVNWCPGCKTVLADEQVIAGECERCGNVVEQKELEQWFLKITKFSDQLLKNLDEIDWSKRIIESQRNWIGKSDGANVKFQLDGSDESINIFTTRPDTIFGATYMVLAPEHPLVGEIVSKDQTDAVYEYKSQALMKTELQRVGMDKDKTGVFTGAYVINPINGEKLPIWIADYVLMGYGTGAIMAVPAHDERDFVFAKKYNLKIVPVVEPHNGVESKLPYIGEGKMINSGQYDGMLSPDCRVKIVAKLKQDGVGKAETTFRLRDWLISRQRYWSAPIPMIHCEKCGWQPVPETDLPVKLPFVEDWQPKGDGRGPLANIPEFVNTICPKCGGKAERETDTLDNFLDSGWYFFRYPFVNRDDVPFAGPGVDGADDTKPDSEAFKKWLPVHLYVGGPEHAVLHLMYTRFLTMAFKYMGFIDFDEPFVKFFAHGHITKDGKKMSKSLGNIVNPDEYIDSVGADAFRMYLMFLGPFDQGGDFSDGGLVGATRFLDRVWRYYFDPAKSVVDKSTSAVQKALHKTIKGVGEDINEFKFNTTIAKFMEFMNVWALDGEALSRTDALAFVKLIAPFAPFISEEIFQSIYANDTTSSSTVSDNFTSIHVQSWPEYNESLVKDNTVDMAIQVNGKFRGVLESVSLDLPSDKVEEMAKDVVSKQLSDKQIIKVIHVPNKLINFVAK